MLWIAVVFGTLLAAGVGIWLVSEGQTVFGLICLCLALVFLLYMLSLINEPLPYFKEDP